MTMMSGLPNRQSAIVNVFARSGGREGIRTLDLSVANAALSQLSYAPIRQACRVGHYTTSPLVQLTS
jgi:hypothetical protein